MKGVVTDSAGAPVRDADVGIASLRRLVRTDELGRFGFDKLPPGQLEVSVRRLGFEPWRARVAITGAGTDSLPIKLKSAAAMLAAIDVSSTELRLRQNIEDFYRRTIQGTGQYITRDQIEARWGGVPSDMLRNTAGVRLMRSASGGYSPRFPQTSLTRGDCPPMIWVDGQKAPGLEIDAIPLNDVEGIEVYSGPSTTPMQFTGGRSMTTCGTIVVWSRPPQYQRYPPRGKEKKP
ncbi:MAG: carboxypeptidase regulatory-like domain-containing protein [Gemmatimonadaceae bacterium]